MSDTNSFSEKVYTIVQKIPRGKVATYGQIANLIGKPKSARAVGNTLHRNPDVTKTPCFKVVNREGRLAQHFGDGGMSIQARRLRGDGVKVRGGKVDLKIYQWKPDNQG